MGLTPACGGVLSVGLGCFMSYCNNIGQGFSEMYLQMGKVGIYIRSISMQILDDDEKYVITDQSWSQKRESN